jgi:hypothetical protein
MPRAPGPEESANTFIREKAPDIRPNPSPTVKNNPNPSPTVKNNPNSSPTVKKI